VSGKTGDASVLPRWGGRQKEGLGEGAGGKGVRQGEDPQGTITYQLCFRALLQNWDAGGRCCRSSKESPPTPVDGCA